MFTTYLCAILSEISASMQHFAFLWSNILDWIIRTISATIVTAKQAARLYSCNQRNEAGSSSNTLNE